MSVQKVVYAERQTNIWQDYLYSPFGGIAAVVFFTILAVAAMPADHMPRGALFWPGLFMSIGILFMPAMTVYKDPRSFVRAENILALIPVFWVLFDLVQATYPVNEVQRDAVVTSFYAIGTFSVALCIGRWVRPWKMPKVIDQVASTDLPPSTIFGLFFLAFGLGFFRFAYPCKFNLFDMAYYLFESRFAAPWSRESLGGWDSFLDHMSYFGYLLPALTVMLAVKTRWSDWRVVLCVVLSIILAAFLAQGGGRRVVGCVFGVGMVIWVLASKHLRLRSTVILVGVAASLLMLMQAMIEYRSLGLGAALMEQKADLNFGDNKKAEKEGDDVGGGFKIDDNFLRLAQIIELIPKDYPFVYHKLVIWAAVRPIPRVFWEGKPVDPGFDLTTAVGMTSVSLTSSVIGEMYMSAGFFGILIGGIFYGILGGMVSNLLRGEMTPERALVYSIMVLALFAGGRSILELILTSYMLIAWCMVLWLYRLVRGQSAA